ncbi:MAG TPA: universal stress protein [Trichocoleus sp.]
MFQRALICTDFADGMHRLAHFISSLAEGGFKELVFFHNVAVGATREIPRVDPEQIEAQRKRLSDVIRDVPAGVNVKVEVQVGRPSDNILRLAKTHRSDVIFLGTPIRTLLEEKLFGSTTMQLLERTEVPLMILRPQLIATFTTAELDLRCRHLFRYLLVPYEGSSGADHLIQQIKQQIQSNPNSVLERCRLLWVIDEGVRRELRGEKPQQEAETKLEKVQAELAALDLVVNTTVVEGDPLQEILTAAETHDIGAIAICSRGLGGILKWSAPSVAREMIRRCWHPILFYPSPR